MPDTHPTKRSIPALWPIIGVPAFAVVASAILLVLAIRDADPELPAHYYIEGRELDADLARAQRALDLGVRTELRFERSGDVVATLSFAAAAAANAPAALDLRLTHATQPAQDRVLSLQRGADGRYSARAPALVGGPWLVQIADGDVWRLRGRLEGAAGTLRMGVAAP